MLFRVHTRVHALALLRQLVDGILHFAYLVGCFSAALQLSYLSLQVTDG
jgi:hypothetical protein